MAKSNKKEPPVTEWIVPVTIEYRGTAIVKARTEGEANAAAKAGDFISEDPIEIINWEVIGSPERNT